LFALPAAVLRENFRQAFCVASGIFPDADVCIKCPTACPAFGRLTIFISYWLLTYGYIIAHLSAFVNHFLNSKNAIRFVQSFYFLRKLLADFDFCYTKNADFLIANL